MLVITFVLLISSVSILADPNYCYVTDPIKSQLNRYSERVSYDTIHGKIDPAASSCTPSKLWHYVRHADRLPGKNDIGRMQDIQVQVNNIIAARNIGRGTLCQQDFDLINIWKLDPNITLEVEEFLTVSGWDVMKRMGQRFQQAFPTVLPTNYNKSHYYFRYTGRQRTQATVKGYADGLFGENGYRQVEFEPIPIPDPLLRPYDDCPLFDKDNNTVQRSEWENGPEYQAMIARVNLKLGLTGKELLKKRQVRTLWEICNFEQLWDMTAPAPFCGAFTYEDNLLLEYFEDLHFYDNTGYGAEDVPMLANFHCRLVQNLVEFLESDKEPDRVRIFGAHSTAFQLILLTIGVFGNDEKLTPANFAKQANREWKSSLLLPMATNIAVVRYDCARGDNDILFLLNEHPLVIPGCQSNGVCKASFLREKFKKFIGADCDTLVCVRGSSSTVLLSPVLAIVVFIIKML